MGTAVAQKSHILSPQAERSAHATGKVGMILFLASWAMMFGALFYSYGILRARAPMWPPSGVPEAPLVVPAIITVMIIASSVMLEQGRKALTAGNLHLFQRMLIGAVVLGVLFLTLQSQVWMDLWTAGLRIDTAGRFGSIFYFLTIFHAIHVVVGLCILSWMLRTVPRLDTPIARYARAQYAAWFWHFVSIVWLIIFPLVYVY